MEAEYKVRSSSLFIYFISCFAICDTSIFFFLVNGGFRVLMSNLLFLLVVVEVFCSRVYGVDEVILSGGLGSLSGSCCCY